MCCGLQQSWLGILPMYSTGLASAACFPIGLGGTGSSWGHWFGGRERAKVMHGVLTRLGLGEAQLFVSGLWGVTWSVMSPSYLVISRATWLWGLGQPLHPCAGCLYALLGTESESTSSAHRSQIPEIDAGRPLDLTA